MRRGAAWAPGALTGRGWGGVPTGSGRAGAIEQGSRGEGPSRRVLL